MLRTTAAVIALTIGWTGGVASQQRPDFSGEWVLVAASSTPASQSALGSRARIVLQAEVLTLEMPLWLLTQSEPAVETAEFDAPKRYRLDGAEHPMAGQRPRTVRNPDGSPRGSLMPKWPTAGRYRATWTGDQLVILSADQLPVLGTDREFRFVGLTIRTALTRASDGTLVVERIAIQEPVPGPRAQPAPVPIRSVYRRAG